jgi:hypothetical protein
VRRNNAVSLEERLDKLLDLADQIDRKTDRLDVIQMLRDPGSNAAADAYEGLRKQIVAAVGERSSHLNQLVAFDVALRQGATEEDLARLTAEWLNQAAVVLVTDPDHPERDHLFEVLGGEGDALVVRQPAYVDAQTGRLLRAGRAERVSTAEPPAETEAVAAPPDGDAVDAPGVGELDDEPAADGAPPSDEDWHEQRTSDGSTR